jgi:signal peptidase II
MIISVLLIVWLYRLAEDRRWLACALSLILGGALGNLWDRLSLGYVVDFIDVYYGQWHWPAFNMADSAISIGAVMVLLDALITGSREDRV